MSRTPDSTDDHRQSATRLGRGLGERLGLALVGNDLAALAPLLDVVSGGDVLRAIGIGGTDAVAGRGLLSDLDREHRRDVGGAHAAASPSVLA